MSKIKKQFNEGDDVEIIQIKQNHELGPKYWTVPFVNEVEEFNETMGKPNNLTPDFKKLTNWCFFGSGWFILICKWLIIKIF